MLRLACGADRLSLVKILKQFFLLSHDSLYPNDKFILIQMD